MENERVFEQARDPATPLLERIRFAAITASNLDEFFEIRVAGIKQQMKTGVQQRSTDGLQPAELFKLISDEAHALVDRALALIAQRGLAARSASSSP